MDSITCLQGPEPKEKTKNKGVGCVCVGCLWTTFRYPIQLLNGFRSWTLLGPDPNTHLPVYNKCRAGLLHLIT